MNRFYTFSVIRRISIACSLVALAGCPTRAPEAVVDGDDAMGSEPPPRVIVLIGDGMGPVHEDLTSRFVHDAPDSLVMQRLPMAGQILSASPSGLADSASAATAMATGRLTLTGRIAIDRDGNDAETIVEQARQRGMATGIVTTALLPHATPAAFTARNLSRGALRAIAENQARELGADVMLGGGRSHFEPGTDLDDLIGELASAGYAQVEDADQLAALDTASTNRLFGAFAAEHMPYVIDRQPSDPDLVEMTAAALAILERDPDGFFLMVEGARIDHASHGNRINDTIAETAEFDRAVATVVNWAAERENVTIVVTADHETGGLDAVTNAPAGQLPEVSWRFGGHSNRRVNIRGSGPATELIDGGVFDHRVVYQVSHAAITGETPLLPTHALLANGETSELRLDGTSQTIPIGGSTQLDRIRVDADVYGLTIGLEGLFSFTETSLVVVIDADFGAATGPSRLFALPGTFIDPVNRVVANLVVDGSAITGFGIDAVAVSRLGVESKLSGGINAHAGFRLIDPGGLPNASVGGVVINYDDGVRQQVAAEYSGAEVQIPWDRLFPGGAPTTEVAVFAVITDVEALLVGDQALPPTSVPGVIESVVVINAVDSALTSRLEP